MNLDAENFKLLHQTIQQYYKDNGTASNGNLEIAGTRGAWSELLESKPVLR
jgi:hypothetical protein